ncbi:hypothetical protein NEMBOFW57_001083 [Staphylotrichum longicolle]|uniref:Transcription factor domain-containing protein n=1 Tax=Staphylotrichum longicolle TaxID=669026 RepID=A0AAD4F0I1_9PEZI|nr:hypothetical protein NEMBOFW57_001083 [Staphylotrichum longicolle]
MGGPTEGTYSVQPRHMNVKHPRNLNDNDIMTFDDSTNSPVNHSTQMSYFLQRIRIGEIIRAVLDASHPGSPDGDIADYDQILILDRLFEQAFLDLPPFFQGQRPLPPQKLDTLELQRVIIQLGLLSRRARLHRPFLLQQRGYEPRHHRSREICLQSTRAVVALSINIIQCSLNLDRCGPTPFTRRYPEAAETSDTGKGLSAHRLGLVINHLSTACTVLALYTGSFSASNSGSNPGIARGREGNATDKLEWAEVSDELAQACRVLGALEAESPVAADMLRNLVALLKRYRVQGAGVDNDDRPKQAVAAEVTTAATAAAAHEQTQWMAVDEMAAAPPFTEPMPRADERVAVDVVPDESSVNLDGLWDDFVMDSCHSYDQLFADLDYYCGIGY